MNDKFTYKYLCPLTSLLCIGTMIYMTWLEKTQARFSITGDESILIAINVFLGSMAIFLGALYFLKGKFY